MLPEQWFEQTLNESDTFRPQNCSFVELWAMPSGQEAIRRSGELAAEEVGAWVKNEPEICGLLNCGRPDHSLGGIRCLVGSANIEHISPLPLDRSTFRTVSHEFSLPPSFFQSCVRRKFGTVADDSKRKRNKIISWTSRQWFSAAAWSYDERTRTVLALVLAWDGRDIRKSFVSDLLHCNEHSLHPMLIPTLLATREIEQLRSMAYEDELALIDFEERFGAQAWKPSHADEQFFEKAQQSTRGLMDLVMKMTDRDVQNQRCLRHLQNAILTFMGDLESLTQESNLEPSEFFEEWTLLMEQSHTDLTVRIKCITEEIQYVTLELRGWKSRAELLLSGLQAILSQRDTKWNKQIATTTLRLGNASKRDSSSMKALAVVTTVFLPPSFVATFLSMPIFEENLTNFWVFWAVCVPLTALTISIWMCWMAWIDKWNEIMDVHAEESGGDLGRMKIPFRRQVLSGLKFLFCQWETERKDLKEGLRDGRWRIAEDEEMGNIENGPKCKKEC